MVVGEDLFVMAVFKQVIQLSLQTSFRNVLVWDLSKERSSSVHRSEAQRVNTNTSRTCSLGYCSPIVMNSHIMQAYKQVKTVASCYDRVQITATIDRC